MTAPDIGNAHVIDWYLWQALQVQLDCMLYGVGFSINGRCIPPDQVIIHDPEDWTRYDGEIL